MKSIPKFLNKGKLPQIKIGNKWVDLESKGNGEFTAGGRNYTVDSKSTSATRNKELVVTPKGNKIVDKDKVRENNKKAMSLHRSAFNGSDILYPVKKGFDVVGRGLYSLGQGIERAASQTSPYGSIRPTNPNWMEASTPLTNATFLYVLPTMMPSRWVGTMRTGKAPWNPENPGLGDEDTNLLFDIGVGPKFVPAEMALVKKGVKGAGKTFNYILKALSEERPPIDLSKNIDLSHLNYTEPLLADLPMSSSLLLYNIKKGKIGFKELSEMVGQVLAKWIMKEKELLLAGRGNLNKLNEILEKAAKGNKGKRGSNTKIDEATNAELAQTPKGRLKLIREKYLPKIELSAKKTGINWSDQYSVMASMPDELKLSTVGFDKLTTFLERYYNNVSKVIGKGGMQEKLLKSGELRRNANKQWEGKFEEGYRLVEPTEYIKMRIANDKGYNFDLAEIQPGSPNYPMHGTMTKDYKYLIQPSSSPGKNGYWTGILDALGIKSRMLNYYKGKGASVPFFRMPDFELPIMKPNGISSSNSYGGTGQSLMDMLLRKPGKILRPTYVSDPLGTGLPFNEYNFGPNVPNPKSMWNTLDFEPGAGPLAYNTQNDESNFA